MAAAANQHGKKGSSSRPTSSGRNAAASTGRLHGLRFMGHARALEEEKEDVSSWPECLRTTSGGSRYGRTNRSGRRTGGAAACGCLCSTRARVVWATAGCGYGAHKHRGGRLVQARERRSGSVLHRRAAGRCFSNALQWLLAALIVTVAVKERATPASGVIINLFLRRLKRKCVSALIISIREESACAAHHHDVDGGRRRPESSEREAQRGRGRGHGHVFGRRRPLEGEPISADLIKLRLCFPSAAVVAE